MQAPREQSRAATRIIAVAGGKGGVGKSVLSANLAIAMAGSGRRVALVDADIGMGNQHTLLGIARPGPGLVGFLRDESLELRQVAVDSGHPNLVLYPSDGALGVPQVSASRKDRLIDHVSRIEADVVILDIGAGAALTALDLFAMADLHVLVLTGQVTSIQNAYGFLKASVQRLLARAADTSQRRALIEQGWREARPPAVVTLVEWLRGQDAVFAELVRTLAARVSVRLVGNLLFEESDKRVPPSIGRMIRDYLGLDASVAGLVPASRRIHDSITRRRPVLLLDPHCPASAEIRRVAERLLAQALPDQRRAPDSSSATAAAL
ncbi:MAG TPA: P-loop NTPase [Kofleriaceae bacterium]|nr:P-loop NTPase [Kofleriaceae bacterium]